MDDNEPPYILISHKAEQFDYPALRLEGEAALGFLEASGSGWIRDAIEDEVLDAEYLSDE